MKILLVSPTYHNYYSEIVKVLQSKGNIVSYFSDAKVSLSSLILTKLGLKARDKDFVDFKNVLSNNSFDLILVIRGERLLNEKWYEELKRSSARKILYQWDSVRNFNYLKFSDIFDKVFTFDRQDSIDYDFQYLPLFYISSNQNNLEKSIDLLFVGIWHSDRIDILTSLYNEATLKGFSCCFKVYYPYYLYLYLVYIKRLKIKSDFFIFKPIALAEMIRLYQRSKCVVDIAHPHQTGLTMRTIEALGNNKKLITTNFSIVEESFYHQDQICILDRNKIILAEGFVDSVFLENNEIKNLEINCWLETLLKDE